MALRVCLGRIFANRPKVRRIIGNQGLLSISFPGNGIGFMIDHQLDDDVVAFDQCTGEGAKELDRTMIHPIFPEARLVIMNRCDQKFVYYNACPSSFPKAEAFVINGNPGGSLVKNLFLYGYENDIIKHRGVVYLTQKMYLHHLNRSYSIRDNFVRPAEEPEMKRALRLVNLE